MGRGNGILGWDIELEACRGTGPGRVEAEALGLPESARARLAKSLLLSLGDNEPDAEEDLEGLWAEEAERRYREIERGEVTPISSEEVLREARSRLK
ncbi:MAG TPA: addiction module protein [Thermoanaerobaculia bacterium]